MATGMIVGKVSGGSGQFVSEARDRRARVSTGGTGTSVDKGVDVRIQEQHRAHGLVSYGSASLELDSSDTSEDGSSWMHGFETGDMVWGKVKSHPWWPGHIFHESFASPAVRRSRREGHVLVAFFGDSSYGWFEPAELLPFDPHFAEKSKQTTSRNFLKAVEEAVDEVSRRRALAFSCLCRSPRNFRPASTPGYYAVDVIGYESGLIFSARQIKRARDSFVPVDVVSFLKKLATAPHGVEQGSLDATKMMATVLSLRKASYEEFDETYAQAFGVEPVRPPRNELGVVEPPAKIASRAAPLTGPLVFAEALGKKKGGPVRSATKAAKDQAKKNKYLFKRRDDAPPTDAVVASPPPSAAGVIVAHGPLDGVVDPSTPLPSALPPAAATAAVQYVADSGDYVLQKRPPPPPDDSYAHLTTKLPSGEDVKAVGDEKKQEQQEEEEDRKPPPASPSEPATADTKPLAQAPPPASPPPAAAVAEVRPRKPFHDATLSGVVVDHEKKKKKKRSLPQVDDTPTDTGEKKPRKKKKLQVPHEETTDTGEKKPKKKKKKYIDPQTGLPVPAAPSSLDVGATATDSSVQEARKSPEVVASPQERIDSVAAVPPDTAFAATTAVPSFSSLALPKLEMDYDDLDFKRLVPDLAALALDPFHGSERNLSLLVRHVFLLFRSLVYQKSLPLQRPSSGEKPDVASQQHEVKPRSRPDTAAAMPTPAHQRSATGEDWEQKPKLPSGRPPKPAAEASVARSDDPTKTGRKRPLSDRQEERSAKKEKKLSQVKALTSQKKSALKAQDGKPKEEPRETGTPAAPPAAAKKVAMADSPSFSAKKPQDAAATPAPPPPAAKVPSPTFLIIKFPPRSTLPSISSLKARFGRFGPLDVLGCRVFWKTYTCKVLFKFRADAEVAHAHVKNNNIFGQINVTYSLREVEVAQPADAPDAGEKRPSITEAAAAPRTDAAAVQFRPGRGGSDSTVPPPVLKKTPPQKVQSQPVQLKSILKKPSMDDSAGANGAKETPRVKFMIDVEANNNNNSTRREPPSGSYGGGGGNGSSVNGTPVSSGADVESFNSKISRLLAPAQTPTPPPPPPVVPTPRSSEAYRGPPPPSLPLPHNVTSPPIVTPDRGPFSFGKSQPAYPLQQQPITVGGSSYGAAAPRYVDISGEMLSLLRRCKDIVSSVQSTLGYAAYRPL